MAEFILSDEKMKSMKHGKEEEDYARLVKERDALQARRELALKKARLRQDISAAKTDIRRDKYAKYYRLADVAKKGAKRAGRGLVRVSERANKASNTREFREMMTPTLGGGSRRGGGYSYDPLGRSGGGSGKSRGYSYDPLGRSGGGSNKSIRYSYDPLGRSSNRPRHTVKKRRGTRKIIIIRG